MIGWAKVYERGDHYVVAPMARTEAGFRMAVDPVERLVTSVGSNELGAAIRRAVERPKIVVPNPDPHGDDGPSVVTIGAGCRTDREFMKGARFVSVWVENGRVALTPSLRQGTRGFDLLPEHEVELAYDDDEQLGAAARQALQISR